MAGVSVAIALLVVASPLLLASKLALTVRGVAPRVRCAARLVLLFAAYVAIFQAGVLIGYAIAGADQRRFQRFIARLCRYFFRTGFAMADMRLIREGPAMVPNGRPLIVFARHAGLINGTLLLHQLFDDGWSAVVAMGRRAAEADVGLQIVGRPLGWKTFRWNARGRSELLISLLAMAHAISPQQALMIFPEGTNYTAARRQRVIARLRAQGRVEQADRAERLRHTVDPTAGGARAMVVGAPDADVLFVGHTGLEDLLSWTGRLDYPASDSGLVRVASWRVPAEQVPRRPAGFDEWLHGWWQTVDDWIGDVRRTREAVRMEEVS